MNDSQTVRGIQLRAQAAAAQHSVTLSRHTALRLAISVGRKGGFLTLIMTGLIIISALDHLSLMMLWLCS